MIKYVPTIKIHPIIVIFLLIAFITGTFIEIFTIISIVFFHELGHFFAARFFNWRVLHIKLWIFGGVLQTEEHSFRPLIEQAIVALAGPFQHVYIYIAIFLCSYFQLLPSYLLQVIFMYNTIILLFNLLPIWPLDGGKLLFILLSLLLPYRYAHEWTIKFSIVLAIVILFLQIFYFPFTLSASLIFMFILLENWSEWKERFFIFLRFLLQRFHAQRKKVERKQLYVRANMKLINVLSAFKISDNYIVHVIFHDFKRVLITEEKCIEKFFDENKQQETIGEVVK